MYKINYYINDYQGKARHYDPAMARFTQMDPLSEQYPHLSPIRSIARNMETIIGKIVAGKGNGYPIYFYGSQHLKQK